MIIYDPETKFNNLDYPLGSFQFQVILTDFTEIENQLKLLGQHKFVFDLSEKISEIYSISRVCEEFSAYHFVLNHRIDENFLFSYSLVPVQEAYIQALGQVLGYFNITSGVILNSEENHHFRNTVIGNFQLFIIEDQADISDFVGRLVIPLGARFYGIFTDAESSRLIQDVLETKKLLESGDGLIMDRKSAYQYASEGALILTEKGHEFTKDDKDYLHKLILYTFEICGKIEAGEIRNLDDLCPNKYCVNEFSLVNIQDGARIIVGNITEGRTDLDLRLIRFPGNSHEVPDSSKKVITVSISSGAFNYPEGNIRDEKVPIYATGATACLNMVNTDNNMLANFHLNLNHFDCGQAFYDPDYGDYCFGKDKTKLGLAHISPYFPIPSKETQKTFQRLNIDLPIIGVTIFDNSLLNTEAFPWYSSVRFSAYKQILQFPTLMRAFG